MTISSSVSKTPTYACNGAAVSFPYAFKILSAAEIAVILEDANGAQTTLSLGTDYSLTGIGSEIGGVITTAVAYAAGNKLIGVRRPSFLQNVDLQNQGAFFAQVIEDALDLGTMRDQSLQAAILNSMRAPDTETVEMILPSAAQRANKYLIFDANGQPTSVTSQIDARYYGALAADPATRPDGAPRQAGDAYFNTVSLGFRVYSGIAWQTAIPPAALTLVNFTEVAATAKTTFTIGGGYTAGTSFAFLNGVLLAPDEVTMSNGTTAVLSSACAIGDEFRLMGFSPFSVADTLARSSNLNDLPSKPQSVTNLGFTQSAEQISTGIVPAGAVLFTAADSAPTGWIKANGAAISRTAYAALFAAIGTTYGVGDGATTFNLPDLRGEFLRGLDDGRGVDAGRALGSAQSSQNLDHTHTGSTASAGDHTHAVRYNRLTTGSGGAQGGDVQQQSSTQNNTSAQSTSGVLTLSTAGAHTHTLTIANSGGGEARPRNLALLACIKF